MPYANAQRSEESIYNLIQKPAMKGDRQPRYRSRFPGDAPPTGSTFGRSAASQIMTTNLAGDSVEQPINHPVKRNGATLGPKNTRKPDPTNFLRTGREIIGNQDDTARFRYTDRRKEAIVPQSERPPMGRRSSKNFLAANAIEAITARPFRPKQQEIDYCKKPDYGKVPAYLQEVKKEVSAEQEYIRQLVAQQEMVHQANQPQVHMMPEEERLEMLGQLKDKWEIVNDKYQRMTHRVNLDTIGKVRRKEQAETELQDLEKSIEKLSKPYVLVQD